MHLGISILSIYLQVARLSLVVLLLCLRTTLVRLTTIGYEEVPNHIHRAPALSMQSITNKQLIEDIPSFFSVVILTKLGTSFQVLKTICNHERIVAVSNSYALAFV